MPQFVFCRRPAQGRGLAQVVEEGRLWGGVSYLCGNCGKEIELQTSTTSTSSWPAKDLLIETFRSHGPGGQHVNTTDSAVRIKHLPTGTVAGSQSQRSQRSQRSQHANRKQALKLLQAKLCAAELENVAPDKRREWERLDSNAWGQHFRSYIMHPYSLVRSSEWA